MDSSAYGFFGTPLVRAAKHRQRRPWRIARVLTPTNLVAILMLMIVAVIALGTVVPYRIINTSEVCTHCGGFRYSFTRAYGGVSLVEERLFVNTRSSSIYERLVAPKHTHNWILSGECRGAGNFLEQWDVQIIRGSGAARAEQLEQSLVALSEAAGLVE